MAAENQEPQENLAPPENGAEPDYTGLEEYVIYPRTRNGPPVGKPPALSLFPKSRDCCRWRSP